MAASSIDTILLLSPGSDSSRPADEFYRAPAELSFRQIISNNIRTLSTNGVSSKDEITGFLYVPDLDSSDPCSGTSASYLSTNVTRKANLPSMDHDVIAIAPWISADCTLSYLAAAQRDSARAFIAYPTDHSSDRPPAISDAFWGLGDGGQWKSKNEFPVYAIPGRRGDGLISSLAHYSGNMTDVEHGHELAEIFDSSGYARLYTDIETNYGDSLPNLWMLLWVVIAAFLVLSVTSSSIMYYVLRRRRRSLIRRVANGEVDLEALGIKQLTVPKAVLDKMPIFTYVTKHDSPRNSTESIMGNNGSEATSAEAMENPSPTSSGTDLDNPTTSTTEKSYTQSTCPICLDDYVSHVTAVRELQPCSHIYHPDCIDAFLQKKSSLCPMCKTSVLPRGYCPRNISLTTVRREYISRQQRDTRVDAAQRPAASVTWDNGSSSRQRSRRRGNNGVGWLGLHQWIFGGRPQTRRRDAQRGTLPVRDTGAGAGAGAGGVQLNQMTTTPTDPSATSTPQLNLTSASSLTPAATSGTIENGTASSPAAATATATATTEINDITNNVSHEETGGEREVERQGKWRRRWRKVLGRR
ncbi:MAG: hypothetical protein M1816_006665 [Peltula sp. TS41687]|nr:MAG: hypothetical protein M1816_006665 [Peltula sp. TS41687]